MKKLIILFFLFTSSLYAQTKLKMESVQIGGYVGGRIEDCIRTRVQLQDVDHLTAPFRTKNDTASWQTEFWGKWVQGLLPIVIIIVWRYMPRLKRVWMT